MIRLSSLTLAAAVLVSAVSSHAAEKTLVAPPDMVPQQLFNGKTLEGWSGLPAHWKVEENAITGYTTKYVPLKNNTFLVWTNGSVANFELHLKYKIVDGNSGIQYRSELKDPKEFIVGGYQADIDASPRYSGILYEERGRGILADRGQQTMIKGVDGKTQVKVTATIAKPEELQQFIKKEDWNEYIIVARGNNVMHFINGHLMSNCVDLEEAKAPKKGVLALQIHVGPPMRVQFKDILLYNLDAPAKPAKSSKK